MFNGWLQTPAIEYVMLRDGIGKLIGFRALAGTREFVFAYVGLDLLLIYIV